MKEYTVEYIIRGKISISAKNEAEAKFKADCKPVYWLVNDSFLYHAEITSVKEESQC